MDSLNTFLNHYIDKLTDGRPFPIDLASLSNDIGVIVEEREMIPEAAMQPRGGRFHIYVQRNFLDLPGMRLRRRFSWAHEIGHTLFYEMRDGQLKARRDAPRANALEAACHKAASMILVPTRALRAQLQNHPLDGAAQIARLAERFDVSIEVMVRRLNEFGVFEDGWAAVLTRRINGAPTIQYASYPSWLQSYLRTPKRGGQFSSWFSATEQSDGVLRKRFGDISVEAVPVELTTSLVLFELRVR